MRMEWSMKSNTLASAIINMMLMHQKPSSVWTSGHLSFKELEQVKDFFQKTNETVFAHTMKVLDSLTIKNPITLWAALFHDLGKFFTREIEDEDRGFVTFHGHPEESVNIAHKVLSAWQEDPFIIDRVKRLILTHMLDIRYANDKAARKLFSSVGKDNVDNWFALREADIFAYPHAEGYINLYLAEFKKRVELYRTTLIRENDLYTLSSNDTMHICGE